MKDELGKFGRIVVFVNSQPVINPSIEGAKAGVKDFITEVKAIHDMHLGLLD